MKNIIKNIGIFAVSLVILTFLFVSNTEATHAATITVNSKADIQADDGECTLREAVIAANTNVASGSSAGECVAGDILPTKDTINFAITGTADFINNGENGYSIMPDSSLPEVTEAVTIDGYSQTGARPNTAVAPRPFDGILLIELSGNSGVGSFRLNADNTVVRGFAVNSFDSAGFSVRGNDVLIKGNYIGVNPTGLVVKPNSGNGINGSGVNTALGLIIGGTNPADRNIISGNQGSGITPNTGQNDWIIKGNYVGLGSDGLTAIGNSIPFDGPGGLSIDNCTGTIVGGKEEGAANVISGNKNFGIFPDNTDGLIIQGNIIGPDWKGDPIPNNPQLGGIGLPAYYGPFIDTLIGGVNPGQGNIIAHNNGTGIAVISSYIDGVLNLDTNNISILGNSIFNNAANSSYIPSQSGLGIDLMDADFVTMSSTTAGVTLNDVGDGDVGANNYINFPVLNLAQQNGENLIIDFDLDAADSPVDLYRVEFFINDEADPSGYGEGQTFLGAVTVSNGSNQSADLSLGEGMSMTSKVISANTTAVDNTTSSGFGATSEFSKVIGVSVANNDDKKLVASSGKLANTGRAGAPLALLAGVVIQIGATIFIVAIKNKYIYPRFY